MNADVIRLTDLVPEYARQYKTGPKEAAYALHELFLDLYTEYHVKREETVIPSHILWVGSAGSSKLAVKSYKLFFNGLIEYFNNLFNPLPEIDDGLVRCYCVSDSEAKDIPAGIFYLSRTSLSAWVLNAGIEPPEFISGSNADQETKVTEGTKEFKTIELGYISKIFSGLVELVKEVDKAHSVQSLDDAGRRRADAIKRGASRLSNPSRKNFDLYSALISLAEDAGVDMPKDHKTLRKYMLAQSKSNSAN
ncbi:MAG: hypothetical protein KIC49_00065 [Pseudomonas fluorescens]|nr:hypothetical protein [Pseudomonas fluorescens]